MESRIIKIVKNTIYFTSEFGIHLNQTNFPKDSISFKYHLDIYLEVELLYFDVSKKTLEIKILDYSPENTLSFNNQKLKRPIRQLIFRELEWNKLQKLLSSFLNSLPKKIPDAFKINFMAVLKEEDYDKLLDYRMGNGDVKWLDDAKQKFALEDSTTNIKVAKKN